ncbi:Uncharacterized protein BM_BM9560 [Brugia malayi]|uniref:Uncharacterized protein n=1 Tax=Brugia malayi TaxID=6279 RepID=A0A4E9EXH9_BRUMA|nr:Uncharacterized protein BM_BM9560 [Brugia malayi]VIO88915.1 Uncharacterized protein BM_BM9560 [Brugia malayi]
MLWKSSDSTPAELVVDDSAKDDRQIMSNRWMREGRNEAPVAKAKDLTIILLASVVFLDGSESSDDEGIIR